MAAGRASGVGARASSPSKRPSAAPKTKNADVSLERALVAYGEYHHNFWNQLIHLVCVPALLFTLLVALAYVPVSVPLSFSSPSSPPSTTTTSEPLLPLLALLAYSVYYTRALDAFAGASWTLAVGLPLWWSAVSLWRDHPAQAWRWALGAHALSWFLQIVPGHGLLERRRPALVDSFWQAIATAPLFVFVEALFALGWNAGLRGRVKAGVEAALGRRERMASLRGGEPAMMGR